MSIKLIGSEPDDDVPDSFTAYLDAMHAQVIVSIPPYMEIPFIEDFQNEELFNTCAGVLPISLKELIEDYAADCIRDDGGDGLLALASFFEQAAKQMRGWHETLAPEEIAKAKEPITLVFPE